MAKHFQSVSFLAAAIGLLCLFGIAHCSEDFLVEGKVYCDTCRIAFETQVSEYMPDAKVRVECRDREGGHLTYSVDGKTDATGTYKINVKGDHEDEICEVVILESSRPDCTEILPGRDRARILITANSGIEDTTRYANSLAFLKKEPLPSCPKVLEKLGLLPSAMIP